MLNSLKVLTLIAFTLAALQIADLFISLISTDSDPLNEWAKSFAVRAFNTWAVYWLAGLAFYVSALIIGSRLKLLSSSLGVAGAYMMLLGNHGGMWGAGNETLRIATSIGTFVLFLATAITFDRQQNV